jgi:hypothetical protein
MGKAYKNFWSLNTDEAVVTGILRDEIKKDIEVFMPINAQMKDVDLLLVNLKNKKQISIQVKGSRAYEPSNKEVEEFGSGSCGWFFLKEDTIQKSTADYFMFLIYVINQSEKTGRRSIEPHIITIPAKKISELSKKHKVIHKSKSGNMYSYYLWVTPSTKKAFDIRERKEGNVYDLSEYLDKKGFENLNIYLS